VALLDLVCHNPLQVREITPGVEVFSNTELPGKMQIIRFPTQFYPRVQDSETLWRTANRLNATLPMFSVAHDPVENAKGFSEYIRDYIPAGLESIRNELDAIKELTVTLTVQDVIEHGVIAIREGFEIEMILDENAFLESNLHLFCEILNEMLSNLVAMNSFVQLKTSTLQNPEERFLWKPGRYGKSMI
jgi:type VI protein secretion system component VasA